MPTLHLSIGIVGAGGFAAFAGSVFSKIPGVRVAAVTDLDAARAGQLAATLQAAAQPDLAALLADRDVDLVYIATPPYLHYEQSKRALEAGKHVICEKPAALRTAEAEELAAYARAHDLLYAVNLMQRYNPLYDVVDTIIRERLLGDFLHGFFENYACDEQLTPEHWFWDRTKSGGIFIEHGVHFFDMFSGWLGPGEVAHALELRRDGSWPVNDRVQATVLYPAGPVTFYHGFNQPKILDRQEMRLQFDRGDVTLYEWVPVKIRLHGILDKGQLQRLRDLLPGATLTFYGDSSESGHEARGKFQSIAYNYHITLEAGDQAAKMARYEQLVRSMLEDQWQWIRDKTHQRRIDATNAVESLRMAEACGFKLTPT